MTTRIGTRLRLKISLAMVFAGTCIGVARAEIFQLDLPPPPALGRPAFEASTPSVMTPAPSAPTVSPANAATRCDLLAATDHDRGRATRGVNLGAIDVAAAIDACATATTAETDPRYLFQLARAHRAGLDYVSARAAFTKAADRGHPEAMVALSLMHQAGAGGSPDLASAYRLAEQAAATGHAAGLYRLAQFYRHPIVGRYDLDRWIALLEKAAEAGSVDALRELAVAYENGIGVRRNADIAADLLLSVVEHEQPRAERDVDQAMTVMGIVSELGFGDVKRDPAVAADWYQKAAAAGDTNAMLALGRLYREGRGLSRDATKACDLFERAARDHVSAAFTSLAQCFETGAGRAQDRNRALQLFQQAIAAGDDEAPLLMGRRLDQTEPMQRGEAREYLRLSAERGNADGMLDYAFHLKDEGASRARDSCDWYERAALLGHARAMNNYGVCFAQDTGGRTQDVAAALSWYERAAARGDSLGLRNLGDAYLNGVGVAADPVKAFDYFKQGADAGDVGSMVEFGMLVTRGVASPADPQRGCDWFEKAAKTGNSRAMNNLGACFANGKGRSADLPAGIAWYEKAIADGDMIAMANLGELYMNGRGVPRDPTRAIALYRRSAELGHAAAVVEIGAALYNGVGLNRDAAAACNWYDKAAQTNHPAGLNGLGVCTENGIGRTRDLKKAIALFVKAAEVGSLTAFRNLVRVSDRGIGGNRNPDAAADWLRKAIDQGYDSLLNDFLSYPSSWSRDMRRSLQKVMKREGLYDGPVDGYLSMALDQRLWTAGASDSAKSDRPLQDFTFAPLAGTPRGLLVRLCKSANAEGRRPLVVINHGLTTDESERRDMRPLSCGSIASFFTQRGYTVAIPLRRGYGETGGRFSEGGTRVCATSPNFIEPGLATAADIQATITHLSARPDIAPDGTIVLGHSGGGWGALALASKNAPGFAGFVNISGVHGSNRNRPDGVCGPEPIVKSTREFGRNARAPTLWIYAENDSHAGPRLVKRMFDTFTREGGNGVLHVLPAYDTDGHNIFDDDSFDLWGGIVEDWLNTLKR